MSNLENFRSLGLSEETVKALVKKGFEEPTPIQAQVIPLLLQGDNDIVGQAQTGTGKTAAFGLPLIEKLKPIKSNVQAIILAPTRELAIQVSEEINSFKGDNNLHIVPIYGGQSIDLQLKSLKRGVDIVVGTPGRVIDHINRGSLKLDHVSYVILDEADEMLNMGFVEDVKTILSFTPNEKKVLLFSATMPPEILSIAKSYMKEHIFVSVAKNQLTASLTDQIYFEVRESDKFEALCRIIDIEKEFYGLIFCRTKIDVDRISASLIDRGYDAEALHGDISQHQRERILMRFKKKHLNIVVATDVAARGIDVSDLTHVINFSLPQDPESYVHRIGRTGRAGKQGTAITFITPAEYRRLMFIQKVAKANIRKETLPGIADIIDAKKTRIKQDIEVVLSQEDTKEDLFYTMAEELLKEFEPARLLSAVLKTAYHDELDASNYKEIGKIKDKIERRERTEASVDGQGTSRLFIAMGRSEEMTPKKLISFLKEKSDIDPKIIKDIVIFENFSFITVPFEDAEFILESFKKVKKDKRPIIARAKARN